MLPELSSPVPNRSSSPSTSTTTTSPAVAQPPITIIGNTVEEDKGKLIKPGGQKSSKWWEYFMCYSNVAHIVQCTICTNDVKVGISKSTGKLQQHMEQVHREKVKLDEVEKKRKLLEEHHDSSKQTRLSSFFSKSPVAPNFRATYLKWTVDTYQPFSTCKHPSFREMIQSVNPKAETISTQVVKQLLLEKETEVIATMTVMLSGHHFALTDDGWTSRACKSYTAVTAHWIDECWKLHSCTLGCKPKDGKAQAEDHVQAIEDLMTKFNLSYTKLVANVTDTEPTMVKAGRLIIANSIRGGGKAHWGPCVDHLLECTTGIAFDDTPLSLDTMAHCRGLSGHFKSSSQANDNLLLIQNTAGLQEEKQKAVTTIQDVITRWWSTYSMCQRLLRLKKYFEMMVLAGTLVATMNLTVAQWEIVTLIIKLLQPFMQAQKMLEGEKYVTISLVPTLIISLRNQLIAIIDDVANEGGHIQAVALRMLEDFNKRWGEGAHGTIFQEHTTEGERRRPKGLPILTILASALDPRFKGLLDFDEDDRIRIRTELKIRLIQVALEPIDLVHQPQHDQPAEVNKPQPLQRQNVAVPRSANDLLCEHDRRVAEYNQSRRAAMVAVAEVANARIAAAEHRVEMEMNSYDAEDLISMTVTKLYGKVCYNNPLEWWERKQSNFPLHAKLARRYLCVPATSAPSERVFSLAGLTIAKERASLNPEIADALIFLHDAWDVAEKYMNDL